MRMWHGQETGHSAGESTDCDDDRLRYTGFHNINTLR